MQDRMHFSCMTDKCRLQMLKELAEENMRRMMRLAQREGKTEAAVEMQKRRSVSP